MTYQTDEMEIPAEPTFEPTVGSQRRQVRGCALRLIRRRVNGRAGVADEENRRHEITTDRECGSWMRSLDRLLCLSFALVSPPYLFNWFPPPR